MKIYCYYPDNFLWYNTINLALKNISSENNIEYIGVPYKNISYINELSKDESECILCLENNYDYTKDIYNKLISNFPNSKIVLLSTDTVYTPPKPFWKVHLYLDTVKNSLQNIFWWQGEHFYWTISEDIIKDIEHTAFKINSKDYDCICLCRGSSEERIKFLNEVGARFNLEIFDLPEIYWQYNESWIVLGHTMSVWNKGYRTMKGFRDWLAPFCGSVLIYDDFPDIIDIGEQILPTYKYGNSNEARKLIDKFKKDPILYENTIKLQKTWAIENTLEKQLSKIFKKHKLI